MSSQHSFSEHAKSVIEIESASVKALQSRINGNFEKACDIIFHCEGRVVVTGLGKSGHIANKIAATFASTGTPAFFIHPTEANHGDLGMITQKDVVLAISYSGETTELLNMLPLIKRFNIPLIALTGNAHSNLARLADIYLDISVEKEACPLGLAPTASTTATLVMGDALAVALLMNRNFSKDDFARFHPGGSLGRKLLLTVADLMHTGDAIPTVKADCLLSNALIEMSDKRLGMTTVVDANNQLIGIFTDGDIRRSLDKNTDLQKTKIMDVMTKKFMSINKDELAAKALSVMREYHITTLPIIDDQQHTLGIIHMHDLLQAGV